MPAGRCLGDIMASKKVVVLRVDCVVHCLLCSGIAYGLYWYYCDCTNGVNVDSSVNHGWRKQYFSLRHSIYL